MDDYIKDCLVITVKESFKSTKVIAAAELKLRLLLWSEYALRSPGGHRVRLYKRCQVDVFGPYMLPDGLVCRLAEFQDTHSLYSAPRSSCIQLPHQSRDVTCIVQSLDPRWILFISSTTRDFVSEISHA